MAASRGSSARRPAAIARIRCARQPRRRRARRCGGAGRASRRRALASPDRDRPRSGRGGASARRGCPRARGSTRRSRHSPRPAARWPSTAASASSRTASWSPTSMAASTAATAAAASNRCGRRFGRAVDLVRGDAGSGRVGGVERPDRRPPARQGRGVGRRLRSRAVDQRPELRSSAARFREFERAAVRHPWRPARARRSRVRLPVGRSAAAASARSPIATRTSARPRSAVSSVADRSSAPSYAARASGSRTIRTRTAPMPGQRERPVGGERRLPRRTRPGRRHGGPGGRRRDRAAGRPCSARTGRRSCRHPPASSSTSSALLDVQPVLRTGRR